MSESLPSLPISTSPVARTTPATARTLGLVTATALVIASMVGTGIFTTSGFLLGDLQSPWLVLLAWLIGGILACLGAISYGALARRIPESGGEYIFLSRTVHPAAGYVAGWISLLVGFSAPLAAAAFGFGEYTRHWLNWRAQVSGTILLTVFALVHGLHIERGAWVQNAAVLCKVILIAGFAIFGLGRLSLPAVDPAPAFSLGTFAMALVWISFSYSGWNAAVYIGGEVRHPEKNLPRALIAGTLTVMILYLLVNVVFVFSAPVSHLAGKLEVGRLAAQALGGPGWANAVTGLVALALVSSVSSMVMAGPRVYSQMASDGYLPARLKSRAGVPPRGSILLQYVLAVALLWSAQYETLLTCIGFTLSLSTAATVFGLMRLRCNEGKSFAVPGWPWVPALFLAGTVAIALLSFLKITYPGWVKLFGLFSGHPEA